MKVFKKCKNKSGFSLVEMIIVVAIMVALTVVMAPQYVKYVQKSRDAVVSTAAEEVLSFAKTEFGYGNLDGNGIIRVASNEGGLVTIKFLPIDSDGKYSESGICTLKYEDINGVHEGDEALEAFKKGLGWQQVGSKSDLAYEISVLRYDIKSYQIDILEKHDGGTGE